MIKIFYFILITSLCIFFFAGCTPRLSQDFIDQYDTPKLTKECPDFSGVYLCDVSHMPFFHDDVFNLLQYTKADKNSNKVKIVIAHKNNYMHIIIYDLSGKIQKEYETSNLFKGSKSKFGYGSVDKHMESGCYGNTFIRRILRASRRAEWAGGSIDHDVYQVMQQENGDNVIYMNDNSEWSGPFGGSEVYKIYEKTIILKRIENE